MRGGRSGGHAKKGCDHFYISMGEGWMKLSKMGQGKVHVSCNYSCTIYFLVKTLLIKLK